MSHDIDTSVVRKVGDAYSVISTEVQDYGRRKWEREAQAREDRLRALQAEVDKNRDDDAWFRVRIMAVCIAASLITLVYIGVSEWQLRQDIKALQQ